MTGAPDILVVGAGPAGAATALHAARAGLRVTLVDRARFPREKVCAEFLNPATVAELRALGLGDILVTHGQVIAGSAVHGPRGGRLEGRFAGTGQQPDDAIVGVSLRRTVLDTALVEAARTAGATVLEELTLTHLLYDRGAVAGGAFVDRGGQVRLLPARLTVGADGLRSRVARLLGVHRRGRPRRLAFVTHADGVAGLGELVELHVGARGYLGINPMRDGIANLALVVPAGRVSAASGRPAEFLARGLKEFPALTDRLAGARFQSPVRVTGPFAVSSRRPVADGAMLVGDAAGFFDPFTGEGIGAALRGARLALATAGPALEGAGLLTAARLAPYVRARRLAFGAKGRVERLIGWSMLAPPLFDRAVRRIEARGWSDTLIGVTADLLPPDRVLNPRFLTGVLFGA